jgi:hypothetical protein
VVTLDCKGHTIYGGGGVTPTTYGIEFNTTYGPTDLYLKNCNITGFEIGIGLVELGDYANIQKSTITHNEYGICNPDSDVSLSWDLFIANSVADVSADSSICIPTT